MSTAVTVYVTYGLFALGGLGVYLLMPRIGRSTRGAGAIFGMAALAGLLGLCTQWLAVGGVDVLFYVSAIVALVASVKMITHTMPVYSALYFVLVVLAVTPLLLLQEAEFLAVALVIVYAGAILVTYVFVIMLSQQTPPPTCDRRAREPFVAVLAGFLTMSMVASQIVRWTGSTKTVESLAASATVEGGADNTTAIGTLLVSDYLAAFELAGVLLLIAMIGAIAVSRKRVPKHPVVEAAEPPGMIGRSVPPY